MIMSLIITCTSTFMVNILVLNFDGQIHDEIISDVSVTQFQVKIEMFWIGVCVQRLLLVQLVE